MDKFYDKLVEVDIELETGQYAQQGLVRNIRDICQGTDLTHPLNEAQAVSELVLKQIKDTRKQLEVVIDEVERAMRDEKCSKTS